LSANETAGALISMMARSTTRSNQRPDTLMQDRKADRSMKTSCDARPDHTLGSRAAFATAFGVTTGVPQIADDLNFATFFIVTWRPRCEKAGHELPRCVVIASDTAHVIFLAHRSEDGAPCAYVI